MFKLKSGLNFILGSSSPRRINLIKSLGFNFDVRLPSSPEPSPLPEESPEDFVKRCSLIKANSCQEELDIAKSTIILSADTIVAINSHILGKPSDQEDALRMLSQLNGNSHLVYTAVCLISQNMNLELVQLCKSKVYFNRWPNDVLQSYIKSGDCLDKAGAYGIQGKGAFLIDRIEGSVTNVAGLPLAQTTEMLLDQKLIFPVIT